MPIPPPPIFSMIRYRETVCPISCEGAAIGTNSRTTPRAGQREPPVRDELYASQSKMAAYSRGGTGRTDIEIEIFRTSAVNPVGPCRELVYNGPRLRPVREFCYARSECKFWIDSDDWHAVADGLGITVQG